jgi:putative ABC transport system permease protein
MNPTLTDPVQVASRLRFVRRNRWARYRSTVGLALRMALHAKPKFIGTVLGVVFAVVLAAQQLGVLFGLLDKNTQFVDNAGADIWIVPPGTTYAQPGQKMSTALLDLARVTPGVEKASALIMAGTSIRRPGGGSEGLTLIGVDLDTMLGGPYNIVTGTPDVLRSADTMFFEDAMREKFGGLNIGSVREVAGYQVKAGGFTWGLMPFGPPFSFAEIDLARTLAKVPKDQLNYVLVKVTPGYTADQVAATLRERITTADVITKKAFHTKIITQLLKDQLGISFGTSTAFGLIIGFIIVMLSMYSSVIDNLREFGTLKAIGLTNWDLLRMLLVQSVLYALVGSLIGLGLVSLMAEGIRSANLVVIIPRQLVIITPIIMTVMCMLASLLALSRVAKLEPGMVFR